MSAIPAKLQSLALTPALDEAQGAEFLALTLQVLHHTPHLPATLLDSRGWRYIAPEPPRLPDLPLLPRKDYPLITRAQTEAALRRLTLPPAPTSLLGRKTDGDLILAALLKGESVTISGETGIGKTALLLTMAHDARLRTRYRRVWWVDHIEGIGARIGQALNLPSVLRLPIESQPEAAREFLAEAGVLLVADAPFTESEALYLMRFAPCLLVSERIPDAIHHPLSGIAPDHARTLSGLSDPALLATLGGNPVALRIAGGLAAGDGLSPDELLALIGTNPIRDLYTAGWNATPAEYRMCASAIGRAMPYPVSMTDFLEKCELTDPLAARRVLHFWAVRGWIEWSPEQIRGIGRWSEYVTLNEESPILTPIRPETPSVTDSLTHEAAQRERALDLHQQGIMALNSAEYERAETLLNDAAGLRQTHDHDHAKAETLVGIGRLYYLKREFSAAIKTLTAAGELLHGLRDEESLDVVRIALGRVYRAAGRYEAALSVFPESAVSDIAGVYLDQGQWDAVIATYDSEPDDKLRRRGISGVLLRAGRYVEALEMVRQDDDYWARIIRAGVYHLQGDIERAVRAYDKLDEIMIPEAERGIAARARAKALAAIGRTRDAGLLVSAEGTWYEARLTHQLFARQAASQALYAVLCAIEGDLDGAESAATRTLALIAEKREAISPESLILAYHTLARVNLQRGERTAALTALESALAAREDDPHRDLIAVGYTHALIAETQATHDDSQAILFYRRALTYLEDSDTRLELLLGLRAALLRTGRIADMMEVSQGAVETILSQPNPDLTLLGYTLATHAQLLNEHGRGVRGWSFLQEWANRLARRSSEALTHESPLIQILFIGLLLRSVDFSKPITALPVTLLKDLAEESASLTHTHAPDTWLDWAARRDLGVVQAVTGDHPAALATLQPLTELEPDTSGNGALIDRLIRRVAYREIGRIHLTAGDPVAAQPYLSQAIPLETDSVTRGRVLRELGGAFVTQERYPEAIQHFTEALTFLTLKGSPDEHVRTLIDLGYAQLRTGATPDAIETLERALSHSQQLPDTALMGAVLRDLGDAQTAQGQARKAAATYTRAAPYLRDSEQLARTYLKIAECQGSLGQYPQALDAYDNAVKTGFKFPVNEQRALHTKQAKIYINYKRPHGAIQQFEAALNFTGDATDQEIATIHRQLGQLYAREENHERARHHFEAALNVVADDQAGLTLLAIAEGHRAQGQLGQAVETFERALPHLDRDSYPNERALALRTVGEYYLANRRASDAIFALEGALEIERTQSRQAPIRLVTLIEGIAHAHEQRDEPDKAAVRYHQLLVYLDSANDPVRYARTMGQLGAHYLTLKRYEDAAKALEDGLATLYKQSEIDSTLVNRCTRNLADVYRAQGRLEEAADLYRKLPGDPNAQSYLNAIQTELAKHAETLHTAEQSYQLLTRTGAATGSDLSVFGSLVFVVALQAQTYAAMGRFRLSGERLDYGLDLLAKRGRDLAGGAARDPLMKVLALAARARLLETENKSDQAVKGYREALNAGSGLRIPPALEWGLRLKAGTKP
jgi:tetratricopeptide (TPR) repeat protein